LDVLVQGGQEHAALEDESASVRRDGHAVEEPLEDVEDEKLVGRSTLAARLGS
jgi:hypothetical protein